MVEETLKVLDSPAWMKEARCANGEHDPDDWFKTYPMPSAGIDVRDSNTRTRHAVRVCMSCPVRQQCLRWAYEVDDNWAVLGGLTPNQRKRLRTRVQREVMYRLGVGE
jgi:WhiB family transcriptional regulator, redox-sensing transcriptional regulator